MYFCAAIVCTSILPQTSVPASIKISHNEPDAPPDSDVKKTTQIIAPDKFILNPKRYHLIQQIQEALAEECSKREVARRLGIGRSTVLKYAEGDPKTLSEIGFQPGQIGQYLVDCIICFNHGLSKKETIDYITQRGCHVPKRTAYEYLSKIETAAERKFALHGHYKNRTTELPHRQGSKGSQADYVTREMIFRFLWFDEPLEETHHAYLFQHYPMLYEIKSCIQSFRQIYECDNMPFLYLFIENHLDSGIASFKSFAKGLLNVNAGSKM